MGLAGKSQERGLTAERLKRLSEIERWHYWFVGRRALLLKLLARGLIRKGQPILDVGCGTGLMLEVLVRQGHRVVGLDLRPEGLHSTSRVFPAVSLAQAEAIHLPFANDEFALVTLLDVIEHTDDRAALAEAHRVLMPGGHVIVAVPAIPWLWSYRDVAAGHLRRYERHQLLEVLAGANLTVRDIHYYQCLLLPLLALSRLFGRGGPSTRDLEDRSMPIINSLLAAINSAEVKLSSVVPFPWGSSLVAVGEKTL